MDGDFSCTQTKETLTCSGRGMIVSSVVTEKNCTFCVLETVNEFLTNLAWYYLSLLQWKAVQSAAQETQVFEWVFNFFFFFQLNAEQRGEMCDHRQRAVQLEVNRQNRQRNKLLAKVQDILDQAQVSSTVWSWSQVGMYKRCLVELMWYCVGLQRVLNRWN